MIETIAYNPPFEQDGVSYKEFYYTSSDTPHSEYNKKRTINGVIIDPCLSSYFDDYPNDYRPAEMIKDWWNRPFIKTHTSFDEKTMSVYIVFVVRCLDGGAWDRSTNWGNADTLEQALEIAKNGPHRRRKSAL